MPSLMGREAKPPPQSSRVVKFGEQASASAAANAFTSSSSSASSSSGKKVQILLFSATVPDWVMSVAQRYMDDPLSVDLVGDSEQQASKDVQHLCLECPYQARAQTCSDLIKVHAGPKGGTIIFCQTKKDCNELVMDKSMKTVCKALHGDIPQAQREVTLQNFRSGRVRCLVATDVAARGLDIRGVDLVINVQPPELNFSGKADTDTYVHRSGRTGRAGRKGVCITLYKRQQSHLIKAIEHKVSIKFQRVGVPQVADMVRSAAKHAVLALDGVEGEMLSVFEEQAAEYLQDHDPVKAMASALAVIGGYTEKQAPRSLLSAQEGFLAVMVSAPYPLRGAGGVFALLNNEVPMDISNQVRGISLTKDSTAAVFDVPQQHVEAFKAAMADSRSRLSIPQKLPELQTRPDTGAARGGGGGGRGGRGRMGGGGGSRGRSFGGGRGGGFRGRGGGFRG